MSTNAGTPAEIWRQAEILRAHPSLEGALFDLPRTTEIARRFLTDQGLADRCELFAGDFLERVTPGYDAYFIKSTLQDWNDEKSVQILRNIRDAMPEHGRVLVTEIVIEPGKPIGHPHPFVDMEMMVNFGGKERTAAEFGSLLNRASLRLERVYPIEGSFFSVVEGSKPLQSGSAAAYSKNVSPLTAAKTGFPVSSTCCRCCHPRNMASSFRIKLMARKERSPSLRR